MNNCLEHKKYNGKWKVETSLCSFYILLQMFVALEVLLLVLGRRESKVPLSLDPLQKCSVTSLKIFSLETKSRCENRKWARVAL